MELTVKVTIGVTPELSAVLRGLTGGGIRQSLTEAETVTEQTGEPEPAVKKTRAKAESKPKEEPKEQQTEQPAKQPTEQPKAEVEEKASYTEEDIREAMHKCRLRIEGPDYKSDTTTQGYQKYHRALTARFKEMAQLLGYEKPSALPAELRKSFIVSCANTIVDDNGEITESLPF